MLTVPSTGIWLLTYTIASYQHGYHIKVRLVVDNRHIVDAVADDMAGNTAIIRLNAGESVWLEVFGNTNGELSKDSTSRLVTFFWCFSVLNLINCIIKQLLFLLRYNKKPIGHNAHLNVQL